MSAIGTLTLFAAAIGGTFAYKTFQRKSFEKLIRPIVLKDHDNLTTNEEKNRLETMKLMIFKADEVTRDMYKDIIKKVTEEELAKQQAEENPVVEESVCEEPVKTSENRSPIRVQENVIFFK